MRVAKDYLRAGMVALLTFAGYACQTAQKPVPLLPPATAPSLNPAGSRLSGAPSSGPRASAQQAEDEVSRSDQDQQVKDPQVKDQQLKDQQLKDQQVEDRPVNPESAAPQQAPSATDPVADLIAQVEKEYQAGLANFQAGKTDEATENFDHAVNQLLESKLDIRSDDRLEKEFDRIVDAVNKLDVGAGQDTEAQQKSEPAPIDETNGLTPAADPKVKAKAQAELKAIHSDLPLMMTDQVAGYISYFSRRGRAVFERALIRSGRYHDMMVSILKEEGVPQDLIYLAQAESGFHPLAVSRVGARGIWQFMASRGRGYGLQHSLYLDDRQDPEKSTRAAARHLKDLYNQFGDWYLAMAAYNSGPGRVQAAVKRTGYADFWELYQRNVLPKETRNYVPIILAVTIMTKNPAQYGLTTLVRDRPVTYDTVTIDYPVDLHLVADCVGATAAQLQDLNPRLLRTTTPREGAFELHLPAGTKNDYLSTIASIPPADRLWWRFHIVRPGDTLASLARSYRTTTKSIASANHLEGVEETLEADARLVIPLAPGKHPLSDVQTYARRITRYKVHKGDTVETVADNFGVPAQMVRRWNGLRGDSLRGRRVLAVHLPVAPSVGTADVAAERSHTSTAIRATQPYQIASNASPMVVSSKSSNEEEVPAPVVHHKVRTGETFYSIANAYNTTVAALKRDNRNVAILRPGMILIVQR